MYRDAEHGEEDGQLEEHGVDQDADGLVVEDPECPLQQRSVTVIVEDDSSVSQSVFTITKKAPARPT